MVKNHLKRIAAPRTWHIERKSETFITRPHPGGHPQEKSLALATVMRDILKVAKTSREIKYILNHSGVIVDGKRRKDPRFAVGLMDVVSFPITKSNYRITLDHKGRLTAVDIPEKEASIKIAQVASIKTVRKGKLQLGLSDGRCVSIDKNIYKLGDAVIFSVPDQKIIKHFSYETNKPALLVGGKHAGKKAKIESIDGDMITLEAKDITYTTKKEYALITGDKEQELTL